MLLSLRNSQGFVETSLALSSPSAIDIQEGLDGGGGGGGRGLKFSNQ